MENSSEQFKSKAEALPTRPWKDAYDRLRQIVFMAKGGTYYYSLPGKTEVVAPPVLDERRKDFESSLKELIKIAREQAIIESNLSDEQKQERGLLPMPGWNFKPAEITWKDMADELEALNLTDADWGGHEGSGTAAKLLAEISDKVLTENTREAYRLGVV